MSRIGSGSETVKRMEAVVAGQWELVCRETEAEPPDSIRVFKLDGTYTWDDHGRGEEHFEEGQWFLNDQDGAGSMHLLCQHGAGSATYEVNVSKESAGILVIQRVMPTIGLFSVYKRKLS